MVPVMSLQTEVNFDMDENGDAVVRTHLLSSSYDVLQESSSAWQLYRAGENATLAVYETRGQFSKVPFRAKLLASAIDLSQRMVDDVRARCERNAGAFHRLNLLTPQHRSTQLAARN